MLYDPFNVLLNSFCWYFVKSFCTYVHQWYWFVIFLFCDIFLCFGIRVIVDELGSVPSSAVYWKSFRKAGVSFSLNV